MQGTMPAQVRKAKPSGRRRWLLFGLRAIWVAAAILVVEVLLLMARPGYERLQVVCTADACISDQLTRTGVEALAAMGLTPQFYAAYVAVLTFAVSITYLVVAVVIFRARADEPIALYVSLSLLLFGTFMVDYVEGLHTLDHPFFNALVDFMPPISLLCFIVISYIFPDGRFVPRWTRWAAVAWVLFPFAFLGAALVDRADAAMPYFGVMILILLSTCLIAPIYRYRAVADPTARQQIKWAILGLVQFFAVEMIFVEFIPMVLPAWDTAGTLPQMASSLIEATSMALLPIAIAFAVLRYRLWDVNFLINRTLVYVPLTSVLAVIYASSVSVSQKLFTSVAGEQPAAVAVFTTIVLTTTFTPIKNWLQSSVDHYFKEPPDRLRELKALEKQIGLVAEVIDYRRTLRRMLEAVTAACGASGGAVYIAQGGRLRRVYGTPGFTRPLAGNLTENATGITTESATESLVDPGVVLPLMWHELKLGELALGPKQDGSGYSDEECQAVQAAAARILYGLLPITAIQTERVSPE